MRISDKNILSIEDLIKFKETHEKIAVFMDMIQHVSSEMWAYKDEAAYGGDDGKTIIGAAEWYRWYELRYHDDWTWIHEVLQKIETQGCIVEISYSLVCTCRICVIGKKSEKAFNIIYDDNEEGRKPIMAAYDAIIEYIDWYNKKNKKDVKAN